MDELVKQITQRTGIGEDKARQAVEATISFLKSRMPAIGSQLDSVLQGSGASGVGQKLEEGLGGVLGKKSA